MSFIRNIWYVAAWSHELEGEKPISRTIIGEPIALFRNSNGGVVAFEDRCPHRHAPLSLGRVEGEYLRCMYHGLTFAFDGRCINVPGGNPIPPNTSARVFPVEERSSWIWVWMGDPALADASLIPEAFGLDTQEWTLRSGVLDYAADYQLINDNLCDLSHLDFVHEKTLRVSTGSTWSDKAPQVTTLENGLFIQRWFIGRPIAPGSATLIDSWSRYQYLLPGLFLQTVGAYPPGTAEACEFGQPEIAPLFERVDQQAVTPMSAGRTRYLFAGGLTANYATPDMLEKMFAVTEAAFAEDKAMIEGQQAIWDVTPPDRTKAFIAQDKAPAIFRRLIARRIADEQQGLTP